MNEDFSQVVTNYFKNDYRERGKVKWNGFFLSDHTAGLKRDISNSHAVTQKLPRMALSTSQRLLQHATANYELVTVQQDIQDSHGKLVPNVTGLVDGFSDLGVCISGQYIAFQDIRAVVVAS
ncbi:hypothetical protein LNP18_06225 [Leuconostoc citreum]|uniref:hypothetical protein n=1 Tax=Leuconostoc citreum TaxID=33964 RepID=UPI00200B2D30|nr:hypothetical protein [Leuconostoc citreum]MCK8605699.1 hypothetical protein [Leuconostoc citreum]